MRRTLLVGWSGPRASRRVEVEIELRETERGRELAISGLAGQAFLTGERRGEFRRDGIGDPRAYAGGQCVDEVRGVDTFAPGWDAAKRDRLVEVWTAWHLNGMNAGCVHQRAAGWAERPIDPSKPLDAYGRHFPGQISDSSNMLAWIRPSEHPDGLLTKPCEVCGYRYGSEWLFEPLPADVVAFIESL